MKLSIGKKVALVGMIFIYGMGIIAINLRDTLEVTRDELTKFYETKMDSCTIDRIDTLRYPSRGTYQVFHTNCTSHFYPIFITSESKQPFRVGSTVSKDSNSVDIRLTDGGKTYNLEIRHPDTEDDRGFGTRVLLGFIGVVTVLILLAPNSRFQKIEES